MYLPPAPALTSPSAAEPAVSLPLGRWSPSSEMERRGEERVSEMVREGALSSVLGLRVREDWPEERLTCL